MAVEKESGKREDVAMVAPGYWDKDRQFTNYAFFWKRHCGNAWIVSSSPQHQGQILHLRCQRWLCYFDTWGDEVSDKGKFFWQTFYNKFILQHKGFGKWKFAISLAFRIHKPHQLLKYLLWCKEVSAPFFACTFLVCLVPRKQLCAEGQERNSK